MTLNGHKLTPGQRKVADKVADKVAMGRDYELNPDICDRLVERGIVQEWYEYGSNVVIRRYTMPIAIHIEWAKQSAGEVE